ncbi:MAG: two pore domain potassium channel family protein [Acidobacteria bacterium]|nr:two pore domain potassium channel family protein [Acidobacteriota bacterium]MBV9478809.1 two pore domain potassium channel family protein [Acidobacteriota bacterium]
MHPLLVFFGAVVLLATWVDIVWTTLGTHGGGPLTRHLNAGLWRAALWMHKRRRNHRLLSFAGSTILITTLVFWVAITWLGWVLIYSSKAASLVEKDSHVATDLAGRIYFVGYTMFTMGNGEIAPNGPRWRILTAICSGSGLAAISLGIAFLLEVLSAVVHRRSLGAYISDLGGTTETIVARAWTGEEFDSLREHLLSLTSQIHAFTDEHLAYPVLHYFHSENERAAASLRLVALHETVFLIAEGARKDKRLPAMVVEPLRSAIAGFAHVLSAEFVEPEHDEPPPPPLQTLRDANVPTVDDATFAAAVADARDLRRFLYGLLHDDGWTWEEMRAGKALDGKKRK